MKPVVRRATSQWQFSLRQVFVGVVAANALFALIAWGGVFGALLFAVALGIALLVIGWRNGDWRFVGAGIALSILAGALLSIGSTVALGVGWTNRSCSFQVCEQITGDSIPGATVIIRDVFERGDPDWIPSDSEPGEQTVASTVADEFGMAVIPLRFKFTERHGRFINDAHIYIPENYWLQVDAPGYQRELVPLRTFTGGLHDYFVPLPKMKVKLKRS